WTKSPLWPNSAARALPASVLRSQRASLAPAPANNRTVAAPSPDAPPVIMATLSASCMPYLLYVSSPLPCAHGSDSSVFRCLRIQPAQDAFSSARNSGRTFLAHVRQLTTRPHLLRANRTDNPIAHLWEE